MKQLKPKRPNMLVQLLVTFVIPIVILSQFSGESQLGAAKGFLVALAFPVVYEVFGFFRHQKPNIISFFAVGGIILTGLVSLLSLSEEWLAVRRATTYLAVALVFIISDLIKRPVFKVVLPYVLDLPRVTKKARAKKLLPELEVAIKRAGYFMSALLILATIATYVSTKVIIISPTNTAAFNQEYVRLRLLNFPIVTLPLVIGVTLVLYYLVSKVEKLTGLKFEEILKKKAPKK